MVNNDRREKLIRFIKANNPFMIFISFNSYSDTELEKIKEEIDKEIERIKNERKNKIDIHLN